MCDFRLDIGLAISVLFFSLAWSTHKRAMKLDTLPPPDRSTKRASQVMDEAARYTRKLERQG